MKPKTIRVRVMHAGRPDLDHWEDKPFDPKVSPAVPPPQVETIVPAVPTLVEPPRRGPSLRDLIYGRRSPGRKVGSIASSLDGIFGSLAVWPEGKPTGNGTG